MAATEDDLLALLNSAPVIDGRITETLDDEHLRHLRDELHAVIRGTTGTEAIAAYLARVSQVPTVTEHGVDWVLVGPPEALPVAELALAWARVTRDHPGRLKACANPECNKFLIDHSKPGTARWCSMATCGNRMKARRHYARETA